MDFKSNVSSYLKEIETHKENILIIDVESTCDDKKEITNEIIEIGIAGVLNGKIVKYPSIIIKPVKSEITPFCTKLTTITKEFINENGVDFNAGYRRLSEIASRYHSWASYGMYDKNMFEKMSALYGIKINLPKNHTNIRLLAAKNLFKSNDPQSAPKNPKDTLGKLGIKFNGVNHRGDDDAYNIAILYKKLTEEKLNEADITKESEKMITAAIFQSEKKKGLQTITLRGKKSVEQVLKNHGWKKSILPGRGDYNGCVFTDPLDKKNFIDTSFMHNDDNINEYVFHGMHGDGFVKVSWFDTDVRSKHISTIPIEATFGVGGKKGDEKLPSSINHKLPINKNEHNKALDDLNKEMPTTIKNDDISLSSFVVGQLVEIVDDSGKKIIGKITEKTNLIIKIKPTQDIVFYQSDISKIKLAGTKK